MEMELLRFFNLFDHNQVGFELLLLACLFLLLWCLYRIVRWAKKMPKGAFAMVAILPLISLFPIPHQEIKKLERIRQEQVQEEEEAGDPPDKNE